MLVSLLVTLAGQSATNRRIDDLGARLDKRIDDLADRLDKRIDDLAERLDKRMDDSKDLLYSELRRIGDRIAHLESPIVKG